jgi:flagellar biosynthesis protein
MTTKLEDKSSKTAVALKFDGVSAPTVTAKGTGLTGETIIKLAKEHGIPLYENGDLAKTLALIPLGDEIPIEVYTVVAEILAYIYYIDGMQAERENHPGAESC